MIFNRKMEDFPSFSCIVMRNDGRNGAGGDLKVIVSENCGVDWSPPSVLLTHEAGKVTNNLPLLAAFGSL